MICTLFSQHGQDLKEGISRHLWSSALACSKRPPQFDFTCSLFEKWQASFTSSGQFLRENAETIIFFAQEVIQDIKKPSPKLLNWRVSSKSSWSWHNRLFSSPPPIVSSKYICSYSRTRYFLSCSPNSSEHFWKDPVFCFFLSGRIKALYQPKRIYHNTHYSQTFVYSLVLLL